MIQLILPSLLLPCRDTSRSSHWHVVSWLCALIWLTHGPKMLILAQRKSWKWRLRDDISPSQQQPGLTLTFCKTTAFRKGRDEKRNPEITIWFEIPTCTREWASFTCKDFTESHLSISESDSPVIVFSVLVTRFKENIQPGLRDSKFSNQEIVKMKAPCMHLGRVEVERASAGVFYLHLIEHLVLSQNIWF